MATKRYRTAMNMLEISFDDLFDTIDRLLDAERPALRTREIGRVRAVDSGVATLTGLQSAQSEELLRFSHDLLAIAFNLDQGEIGAILLDERANLEAGDRVYRTGRVADMPVGDALLGRIVDAVGRPLDDGGTIRAQERRPVEREAPAIMDRAPVTTPLQTGLTVIDALIPVGRGQRELIVGDRQTGKTAIALDTIINQADRDVVCVYCSVGQRKAALAKGIDVLRRHDALDYTVIVAAAGDDPLGQKYLAPYAATTVAEFFMEQGRDALIVYDDLTQHARAYRSLSLLLGRPPGREAYPGDIFYIHARLLERATQLRKELGGGSLTALPIIETQEQNISAYIPTNLISITDGQIYLSPELFQNGVLPAVDVGDSVSRVGGKTQLPAYQIVAGDLRLSYAQFTELESFARFGAQLDEETQQTLRRGRRIRRILQQPQHSPISAPEQVIVLLALAEGLFDRLPLEKIEPCARHMRQQVRRELPHICRRIADGEALSSEDLEHILSAARHTLNDAVDGREMEKNEAEDGYGVA